MNYKIKTWKTYVFIYLSMCIYLSIHVSTLLYCFIDIYPSLSLLLSSLSVIWNLIYWAGQERAHHVRRPKAWHQRPGRQSRRKPVQRSLKLPTYPASLYWSNLMLPFVCTIVQNSNTCCKNLRNVIMIIVINIAR